MNKKNELHQNYYIGAIGLLVSMHIAGFLGLQYTYTRSWFELLVPFNLLVCGLLVILFQKDLSQSFLKAMGIIFLLGFFVELLGVKTKVIFGDYHYQTALGWKLFDVPLIIGLNWFVLIFATGFIGHVLSKVLIVKVLIGALLMVGIDFLIEPVAIRHHFWVWNHESIPLQNYLAWFVISAGMLVLYHIFDFVKENKIVFPLFITQILFFLAHNLTYF